MTFGTEWGWGTEKNECRRIFEAYLGAGGNFVDTANKYTEGTSETMLGEFLAGRRDTIVLATKYTLSMRPDDASAIDLGYPHVFLKSPSVTKLIYGGTKIE